MGPLVSTIIDLILILLNLFNWVLIASVILSWLVAFNIINTHNRVIYMVGDFVDRLTAPVLRPIRRVVPNFGGLDVSPLIALLAIWFIETLITRYRFAVMGY